MRILLQGIRLIGTSNSLFLFEPNSTTVSFKGLLFFNIQIFLFLAALLLHAILFIFLIYIIPLISGSILLVLVNILYQYLLL